MRTKIFLYSLLLLVLVSCKSEEKEKTQETKTNKILLLKVDYTTNKFEGGKELAFEKQSDSFNISIEYQSPGDFGYIKLFYSEINEMIFYGDIIWMGCGDIHFPENWLEAKKFEKTSLKNIVYSKNGIEPIYHYEDEIGLIDENSLTKSWYEIQGLQIVRDYLLSNPEEKVKVYFYTPSVGEGNPADWKWIYFLKK